MVRYAVGWMEARLRQYNSSVHYLQRWIFGSSFAMSKKGDRQRACEGAPDPCYNFQLEKEGGGTSSLPQSGSVWTRPHSYSRPDEVTAKE